MPIFLPSIPRHMIKNLLFSAQVKSIGVAPATALLPAGKGNLFGPPQGSKMPVFEVPRILA
ncbi:MAG: hypothetical protein LBU64_06990 [Planctomycetota bacterium]|nr:hypothetical protein [Planctomycetota bacterium]